MTTMSETHSSVRPGVRPTPWPWIAAIWCVGGLFDASQTLFMMHAEGGHHPWLPLFGTEFASWLPWALVTPLIVGLARRYPIIRDVSLRTAVIHLAVLDRKSVV